MTSSSHQHIFCTADFFEELFFSFLSFFLSSSLRCCSYHRCFHSTSHLSKKRFFFLLHILSFQSLLCYIDIFFILISFGVGVGGDFIGGYEPLPCLLSHQQPLPRRYRLDAASVRRAQIALSQPSHPLKPPRAWWQYDRKLKPMWHNRSNVTQTLFFLFFPSSSSSSSNSNSHSISSPVLPF